MTSSNNSSVLKDVVAYVDVWSSDKRANYSKPFVQQLEEMGAEVSQRFNKRVTHVVFYNGHSATWRKAKDSDVRLVSILWVKSCYNNGVQADEELFPASNDESNPVMKNRKHRCMLPKDSPERTTENDWRMRKKLDKLMKNLPSKEPLASDMSPIIIDEENGIIYSPGLKRSDYMAQRLKDMKDKHENISPTASQMSESCSPTELKPSLGSTPTTFKYLLNDQSDDEPSASVAKNGCSADKDEGELDFDVKDDGHLEQDSGKPWLSPCRIVPKQIPRIQDIPTFDIQADKEGNKQTTPGKTSVRKAVAEKLDCADRLQSHIQDKPDKSKIIPKEIRRPLIRSAGKSGNRKQKTPADKSFTETKSHTPSKAVNSSSCLLSSDTLVDSATEISKETGLSKNFELKTPKKARLTLSTLVRSFALSSERKNVASSSTDADDDVFEDYFFPANHKRPLFPTVDVESNITVPFELDSVAKKRKHRRSEGSVAYNKKLKIKESPNGKKLNQQSDESSECLQKQDGKTSLSACNCSSVHVTAKTKRRSTLGFTSTCKTTGETRTCSSAFTSEQSSPQTEDIPELEPLKRSDFAALSQTVESGENECLVAAAFTEIPSEAEGNHNKPDNSSLQKMVKETKSMRTLVMTSMPTEKQQTVVQVVKALGGFSIVNQVCESTTHVVSGGHKRTLNILLGIARGCWILSFEWILWCLEQRQWIPEEPYELSDPFPAAQICRLQRHLSAGEHQQDLFQNQPAMVVSQFSQPPTQSLVELIELCGGTVCKTVRQAGICIGKYGGRRPEGCRMLSEQWVLDSITNLKIRPYDDYNLE